MDILLRIVVVLPELEGSRSVGCARSVESSSYGYLIVCGSALCFPFGSMLWRARRHLPEVFKVVHAWRSS